MRISDKLLCFLALLVLIETPISIAGPFSDFKGVVLSDEMTSNPTARRDTPTSESLKQAEIFLDPSNSLVWPELSKSILGEKEEVIFNKNIKVIVQDIVEEPHEVPLVIKIPAKLQDLKEFILIVENNPIQKVIKITPHRKIETIGMNIRLESDSPIRAAIKDKQNIWHVGSKMVYVSSPGGCSIPACDPSIETCQNSEVGKISVRQFSRKAGAWRIKMKIFHPMDTGFVVLEDNTYIPSYYLDFIKLSDKNGIIADFETYAALSSDPVIMLDLPKEGNNLEINARDTKGILYGNIEDTVNSM